MTDPAPAPRAAPLEQLQRRADLARVPLSWIDATTVGSSDELQLLLHERIAALPKRTVHAVVCRNAAGIRAIARPYSDLAWIAPILDRPAIERAIARTGLTESLVLHAFADEHARRGLCTDRFLADPATHHLADRLMLDASAADHARGHLVDETRLWRHARTTGTPTAHSSAFVVLASNRGILRRARITDLWPRTQLAAYANCGRAEPLRTCTTITATARGPWIERHPLHPDAPPPDPACDVRHPRVDEHVIPGPTISELLRTCTPARRRTLLTAWAQLVARTEARTDPTHTPIDLVPGKVVVGDDDRLHPVAQDWHAAGWHGQLLVRGLVYTAHELALDPLPGLEHVATTADLVDALAAEAGARLPADWAERFVELEARLQAAIQTGAAPAAIPPGELDRHRRDASTALAWERTAHAPAPPELALALAQVGVPRKADVPAAGS